MVQCQVFQRFRARGHRFLSRACLLEPSTHTPAIATIIVVAAAAAATTTIIANPRRRTYRTVDTVAPLAHATNQANLLIA